MTYSELNQLSIEQLRALNKKVIEVVKMKKSENALNVKEQLYVGANVSVNHPKLAGKQCRVKKINRTKAIIEVLNGASYGSVGSFAVPMNMIHLNK